MNKFARTQRFACNTAAKFGAATVAALVAVQAHAQSTGIDAVLDAVDLSGIATKVSAAALVIVGIALVFKGPALAKRIINRV